jgi:hypothetical protein
MVSPGVMQPLLSSGPAASAVTSTVVLLYLLWTPIDVLVRSSGPHGQVAAVGVAAGALVCFLAYYLLTPALGDTGRVLKWLVMLYFCAVGLSLIIRGGILGPTEYTGNFVFRTAVVFSALVVGYHVALRGYLNERGAVAACVAIVAFIVGSMIVGLLSGKSVIAYVGQGVTALGTATGEAIQPYIIAYSAPLLLLIRHNVLRPLLLFAAIAGAAATFRRGAFVCAVIPLAIMLLADRPSQSQRHWWYDASMAAAGTAVVLWVVGADLVFARWIGIVSGQTWALSERDLIYPILAPKAFALDWTLLFGHGIGSSVVYLDDMLGRRIFAHNDWLEVMLSVGLFGAVPLIALHIVLIVSVVNGLRIDRRIGVVALAFYLQLSVSHLIEGVVFAAQHGVVLMALFGATLGWTVGRRECAHLVAHNDRL